MLGIGAMLFVRRLMGLGLVAQGQNPRQTGSWAPGWHGHRLPDEHTLKTKHTTAADDAAMKEALEEHGHATTICACSVLPPPQHEHFCPNSVG
jgi:hypothetical protein